MDRSFVELKAVRKQFAGGPRVLDGFSLSVKKGDFVGLVGPSGCGKSTILRMIAGLVQPTEGEIEIADMNVADSARELAFVFQEPTLLPWLTVRRNVEVPLTLRGCPAEERAKVSAEVLRKVHLVEKADAYPRQLSGGQKMRVSLARALSLRPEILLLDEPFGALDEMTRDHLNEELLALREERQWTAFFVTHSVSEAVFLSNRVVVMSQGGGRIKTEVPIPLPYPRTSETRRSEVFFELVRELSLRLRERDQS
jgi:NitT/TauT family transport system ATP-binding protein